VLEQAIEEAVRAGELRPVPARIAAAMLFGMLREAGPRRGGRDALDVREDEVMDTFLRGVGAPAGGRAPASARRRSL
jgi:hypothetical protein